MMKVMTVIGTWPETIKMAPVIRELNDYPEEFESVVCATAQHREMLDQVLHVLDIFPHYNLDLIQPNDRRASRRIMQAILARSEE